MYECPNCAANLKFDIASQMLTCEYCGTAVDPYSITKERDAEETTDYEVILFTCPQCGGEILSEDTTAATFCSYCGAATILDSRMSRERRPGCIVPFTKTKEDCKRSYTKMMRRAIFTPKELKDAGHIEKFRGIYMPYWVYGFAKKGAVRIPGSRTHRRGDYLITKHYNLDCELEEDYQGIAYDASSTFSDSLSSAIAPFDLREGKEFTPSFLSGFYADTSDVYKGAYHSEAEELFLSDACERARKAVGKPRYHVGREGNRSGLERALRPDPETVSEELAMLPVWFLAYRKDDRVAYAVVNGQTGKAAADLPVDIRKYLIGSLILAVPIFLLLNMFLTITPTRILVFAMLLAFVSIWVSNRQFADIFQRETGAEDIGMEAVRPGDLQETQPEKPKGAGNLGIGSRYFFILIMCGIMLIGMLLPMFFVTVAKFLDAGLVLQVLNIMPIITVGLMFVSFAFVCWWNISGNKRRKAVKMPFKQKIPTLVKPMGAIALAILILLIHPVRDEFYYIGSFVCMGMVCWSFVDIIRHHNTLTTRKLPQLNRRGGDENA